MPKKRVISRKASTEDNRREIVHLIQFVNEAVAALTENIRVLSEELRELKLKFELGSSGTITLGFEDTDSDND